MRGGHSHGHNSSSISVKTISYKPRKFGFYIIISIKVINVLTLFLPIVDLDAEAIGILPIITQSRLRRIKGRYVHEYGYDLYVY